LLVAQHSDLFTSFQCIGLLREVHPTWLQSRAGHHGRQLMDAYFLDRTPDDSFADYVGAVREDVPPALIGKEGMDAIAGVARLLPGSLALQTFFLECNLSRPEAAGDFLPLVQAAAGRSELAAGIPAVLRDIPIWVRIQAFLDAWGDMHSVLSSTIDRVWLEFDVSTAGGGPPVPSIFHGYQLAQTGDAGIIAPPIERQIEATRLAFQILTDRPIEPAVVRQLRACYELLPSDASVFQLGAMIARETDAFRVCVGFRDRSQILPYLDRLGWRGEQDQLQNVLGQLAGRADWLALDIDVTTSVLPKVGLECYLRRDDRPQAQRWAPFLDFLVKGSIALQPKCEALLRYPGLTYIRLDRTHWPVALRWASEFLGPAAVSVFRRGINHVKLVLEPDHPLEAKAYLSVNHTWVTPDLFARDTVPQKM
jgi:hypothetical protein